MFQFLIGRLETFLRRNSPAQERKFQFLIGRLETPEGAEWKEYMSLFQFLIGRLETMSAGSCARPERGFNSS